MDCNDLNCNRCGRDYVRFEQVEYGIMVDHGTICSACRDALDQGYEDEDC